MLTIPLSHELHVSTKPLPSFSLLELNNSKDYFLLGTSSSTHSALCDISLYILKRLKLSRTVNKKWLEFTAHLLHVHVVCVRSILKHCLLQQEGIKQWCLTCFVDVIIGNRTCYIVFTMNAILTAIHEWECSAVTWFIVPI